jgi:hypothetical protein
MAIIIAIWLTSFVGVIWAFLITEENECRLSR